MDSSSLGVRNFLFMINIFLIVAVVTYYSWRYYLCHLYGDKGNNLLLSYLISVISYKKVLYCNLIGLQCIYITTILL